MIDELVTAPDGYQYQRVDTGVLADDGDSIVFYVTITNGIYGIVEDNCIFNMHQWVFFQPTSIAVTKILNAHNVEYGFNGDALVVKATIETYEQRKADLLATIVEIYAIPKEMR